MARVRRILTTVFAAAATASALSIGLSASAQADPVAAACADAPVTGAQLTGDWLIGAGPQVTTLDADGSLRRENADGTVTTGTWNYQPAELSPAKNNVPASAADRCVLWFDTGSEPAPVYSPWRATDATLEVSLVGRGNTLLWHRPGSIN